MSATSIIFPKFRAFDNDGAVLDGGFVYTYAAGTTTPLATYTDYNAGTANSNPVTLDDSGQADIWLSAAFYKVVLTDKNGVQMWSVDNVGPGPLSSNSNSGFGAATDIASAGLVDLGTIVTHFANITGNQTITSFGASASLTSPLYLVKFAGVLTITQSSSLLTPLGTNITTAAQDHAWLEYLGSGSWRIFEYIPANGAVYLTNVVGTLGITNGGTGAPTLGDAQANLGIFQNSQIFTSNGTFTPAANVTKVFVRVWGAGGAGGGSSSIGSVGGGGGAGGYSEGYVTVTPTVGCTVTVGVGGTGVAGAGGNTGGTSSFAGTSVTPTATGGLGGSVGNGLSALKAGGNGGAGSNGTVNLTGGSGWGGNTQSGSIGVGGNGGVAPMGGDGGKVPTGANGTAGNAGLVPGGGGSTAIYGSTNIAGGAGGNGLVLVYYP